MPYRDSRPASPKKPEPDEANSGGYLHADEKPQLGRQFQFTPKKADPAPGPGKNKDAYRALLMKNLSKLAVAMVFMGVALLVSTKLMKSVWSHRQPAMVSRGDQGTDSEAPADDTSDPDDSRISTRPALQTETIQRAIKRVAAGRELLEQGDEEAAIRAFKEGYSLWPDVPDALHLMGTAFLERGEFKSAERSLREALAASPDNAAIMDGLGLSLLKQGETESARGLFVKAVETDPQLASARLNLSLVLLSRGQRSEARTILEDYLEDHPTNWQVLHRIALVAATERRQEDALVHLKEAIRLAPDQPELYFDAAAASALMNNELAALDYLQHAEKVSTPVEVYKTFRQNAFKNMREGVPGKVYEAGLIQRARDYQRNTAKPDEPVNPPTEPSSLE